VLRYQPSLQTDRLRLRPFVADDAEALWQIAAAREVADTAVSIPHPYSLATARTWIAGLPHLFRTNTAIHFALELRRSGELIGSGSLCDIDSDHARAELGFWIGLPWWGQGYATEAASAIIGFGFEKLSLNRIHAQHMVRNPASGNVLRKLGMKLEGVLQQGIRRWNDFEDVALYAILREDHGAA
jgi:ribosomal-protein-alanine N-acetyltransferase